MQFFFREVRNAGLTLIGLLKNSDQLRLKFDIFLKKTYAFYFNLNVIYLTTPQNFDIRVAILPRSLELDNLGIKNLEKPGI